MNYKSICRLIRLDYESIPHKGGIVHTYISSQAFRILFWLRLGGVTRSSIYCQEPFCID